MDFESPDVEKDFPGLYASESGKRSNESDFSDETHERISKKDLLIGKRKDKKDSKKDRGYATLEGESSPEEDSTDIRSPSKSKKLKPFKFPSKKEKREKSREKDNKEKEVEKDKEKKKDTEKDKDKKKDTKTKLKSKERKKLKHGEESCDIAEELPIFGVSLHLALERNACHDGVEIPVVVRECIMYIQENGMFTESLYKVSGIKSKVQHVRRLYNQRETVKLSDYDLPVVTSLLKHFFRELPDALLTSKLSAKFEEASGIRDIAIRGVELRSLVQQLPTSNMLVLGWIVKHLNNVATYEKQNKMSSQAVAQIFCPALQMSQRLLTVLMYHSDVLFSTVKLTKYIPPLTPSSSVLPETTEEITKELRKQESLLGQIHNEMHAGCVTKQREELLWEVQRMITQLKRKLKSLEKEAVEVHHLSSIQQQYQGGSSTGSTGGSTGDDATSGNVATTVDSKINVTTADINFATSTMSTTTSTTVPLQLETQISGSSNGVTRHIVEAVIETPSNTNRIITPPPISDVTDSSTTACVQEQPTVDELALTLETEELLALVVHLQRQIDQERSDVALLRSQIRNLGGSPSFCDFLLESCSKDSNCVVSSAISTLAQTSDKIGTNIEEQNSSALLLRQATAEAQVLQMQKKNLTDSIIEEQEIVARLKVQVKLLSLNSKVDSSTGTCVISPASGVGEDLGVTTNTISVPTSTLTNVVPVILANSSQCLAR